jgi:hypothetical protein
MSDVTVIESWPGAEKRGASDAMVTTAIEEEIVHSLRTKFESLRGIMDERRQRLWAATEAKALGRGGITAVERASGLSRRRIVAGIRELSDPSSLKGEHVRRPGAGRPTMVSSDHTLLRDLERLVAPNTRGDPMSALRWTCKSTRKLADELNRGPHDVSHWKVGELLAKLGYTLQSPRKTHEGSSRHPDRNAQFEYINARVRDFQRRGQPVVSVDAKKKENIGDFDNAGREWQRKGKPVAVRMHDFVDPVLGKATPYGVYDLGRNEGWVSVGIDHDTAEFAVESLRRWWRRMGRRVYPDASELLVTADGGGSNGARVRLWKLELNAMARQFGLAITVLHYPPGTSKWNKIEHRMFSHITENWRGRPLESVETIVSLIGSTKTRTGLRIRAQLDENTYEKGIKVSKQELGEVKIARHEFHGDWNYTIHPE